MLFSILPSYYCAVKWSATNELTATICELKWVWLPSPMLGFAPLFSACLFIYPTAYRGSLLCVYLFYLQFRGNDRNLLLFGIVFPTYIIIWDAWSALLKVLKRAFLGESLKGKYLYKNTVQRLQHPSFCKPMFFLKPYCVSPHKQNQIQAYIFITGVFIDEKYLINIIGSGLVSPQT